MIDNSLLSEIATEIKRQKKEMPYFPEHIAAGAAVVGSFVGILLHHSIQAKYMAPEHPMAQIEEKANVKAAAIATIAAAIRFLETYK